MYSVPFAIIVVVSCQWSTVHSIHYNAKINGIGEAGVNGCSLWVPEEKALKMPVPFNINGKRYSIIYPDIKGRLNVKFGQNFRLSCTSENFASEALQNENEVLVTCAGGDSLVYKGHTYAYDDFECDNTPKSELTVTGETCQSGNYTVVAVGFRTKNKYLKLYNVCFDKSTKNSLYTWYEARSPYYDNHQKTGKRPPFVNSRELYGKTDVNRKYTLNEQRKSVAKILRSDELADKYIKKDSKHSLSRGHYAAKVDFFFGFEQSATFYYANVAPQWQIFNGNIWADLEETTRHKMDNDTSGRHLIVTGTYGSCTLADVDGVQQPLFLDLPGGIPVPLFFWKLVYDQDRQDGTVYVGLNNPYKEIDDSAYICPNTCPGGFDNDEDTNKGLIYCCTKESFERAYGQLDPIVFRRN